MVCSSPRPLCFVHSLTPPYHSRVLVEWDLKGEVASSGLATRVGVYMKKSLCMEEDRPF